MSASPEPSEQDLHDYVDGRLDGERRAAIADYLAHHPQEAARIEAYRAQMAGLHALYDDALDEPIPAAMLALLQRRRGGRLRWQALAALALLLLAGGAGWWLGRSGGGTPDRLAAARQAYDLYAGGQRWASDVAATPDLAQELRSSLGTGLRLPDLTSAGFAVETVRLVPAAGGRAAVIVYRDGAGRAAALFVAPGEAEDAAPRRLEAGETATLYRSSGGLFYALTAPRDAADALAPGFGAGH
jgi:anti-sigma factor RsiW